jgi:hypothetical protein
MNEVWNLGPQTPSGGWIDIKETTRPTVLASCVRGKPLCDQQRGRPSGNQDVAHTEVVVLRQRLGEEVGKVVNRVDKGTRSCMFGKFSSLLTVKTLTGMTTDVYPHTLLNEEVSTVDVFGARV